MALCERTDRDERLRVVHRAKSPNLECVLVRVVLRRILLGIGNLRRMGLRDDVLGCGMCELRRSDGARLECDVRNLSSDVLCDRWVVPKSVHDTVDSLPNVLLSSYGIYDILRERRVRVEHGRSSRLLQQQFVRGR